MHPQSTFLCACGCGSPLRPGLRYVHGHNRRGATGNNIVHPPTQVRFWSLADRSDPGGCWLWRGCRNPKGYGSFRGEDGTVQAHRFSYALAFGRVPEGMFVCHRCDVPACVRPDHLFVASAAANSAGMVRKGRSPPGARPGMTPRGDAHWMRRHPIEAAELARRMRDVSRARKAAARHAPAS